MAEEFTVEYASNEGFDALVALNITIEGSGAALMAASVLMGYFAGVVAGLALVMLGILFLFFHLGNRFKFWRVIVGIKQAWISRGAFFASGLVFFGILFFLFKDGIAGLAIQIGTVIFGLLVILYSGFLLSSMTPIPFWNSPLTPILFLLHSTTTGMAILIYMLSQSSGMAPGSSLIGFMVCLAGVTLLFTIIHVMVMANAMNAARESVRRLLSDSLKWPFLGGAITLGMIIPLIIFGYMYLNLSIGQPVQNFTIMLLIAVVLRIAGDYAFRSSVLNAGVFEMMI